jgi:hypothetical protein
MWDVNLVHILEIYGEELDSPYLVEEKDGRGVRHGVIFWAEEFLTSKPTVSLYLTKVFSQSVSQLVS